MRSLMNNGMLAITAGMLFLVQAGCSSKPHGIVEIQGQVTLDGQPVQSGGISFYPDTGVIGPTSGAEIRDGHYKISAGQMNGPREGLHRVEITVIPRLSKEEEERIRDRPINAPADAWELANPAKRFRDPSQTVTLQRGVNTYNLDLKSSK